jgi:hypothetical protein
MAEIRLPWSQCVAEARNGVDRDARRQVRVAVWYFVGVAFLVWLGWPRFAGYYSEHPTETVIALVMFAFVFVVAPIGYVRAYRTHRQADHRPRDAVAFFSAEGLGYASDDTWTIAYWSFISEIKETEQHIAFVTKKGEAWITLKKADVPPDALDDLRQLIETNSVVSGGLR